MAVIHDPDKSGHDDPATTLSLVDVDESMNYFSVHWERNATNDEQHPSVENGCGNGACEVYDEDTCLCETTVSETQAFSSLPSRTDALAQLTIGAFSPDMFDDDEYELVEASGGVEAWRRKFHDPNPPATSSPTGYCETNLLGFNADAESGTTADWWHSVRSI